MFTQLVISDQRLECSTELKIVTSSSTGIASISKDEYRNLEYSYCIRAIGFECALFFIDARVKIIEHSCPGCCPACSVFARL